MPEELVKPPNNPKKVSDEELRNLKELILERNKVIFGSRQSVTDKIRRKERKDRNENLSSNP